MTKTQEAAAEAVAHWIMTGRCVCCGKPSTAVERSGIALDTTQNARRRVHLDTHGHAMTCTAPLGAR